jgi:Na+-driven multidrug efflux pump
MIVQLVGAVINIIFDPILIFGRYGFPEMGIAGAAVATVAGQIVAMLIAIVLNLKLNKDVRFGLKYIKPNGRIIKDVYIIGVPSILMVAIGSFMTFCMNRILDTFSSTAIAVFGAYYKLQSFVFMPVFGLNNGLVPIVSYNMGARRKERIKKAVILAMIYASGLMLIGLAVCQLMPRELLGLFKPSKHMLEIGVPALRTISLCFIFAGISIVSISVFQALDKSIYSLIMSAARQLLILIPVAYLMSLTGNLENVWLSFPIAEFVSFIVSLFLLKRVVRHVNSVIGDAPNENIA